MKKSSSAMANFGWAILPFLFLLLFWSALRMTGLINPVLLPSPMEVAQALWAQLNEGNFALNVYMSVQRVVLGLLLGMLLAVPIGFMIGWYRPVRRFVDPLINFFRALPPIRSEERRVGNACSSRR